MQIAQKLKELRNSKGYSTKQVVEELKKYNISLSHNTLYGYENGYSVPNADMFMCLCRIYGITDIDVFFEDEAPKKSQTLYDKLNDAGRAKADEYITDLSFNPKYTVQSGAVAGDIAGDILTELKDVAAHQRTPTSTK